MKLNELTRRYRLEIYLMAYLPRDGWVQFGNEHDIWDLRPTVLYAINGKHKVSAKHGHWEDLPLLNTSPVMTLPLYSMLTLSDEKRLNALRAHVDKLTHMSTLPCLIIENSPGAVMPARSVIVHVGTEEKEFNMPRRTSSEWFQQIRPSLMNYIHEIKMQLEDKDGFNI